MIKILDIENIKIVGVNDWKYSNNVLTDEYRAFKKEIYYSMKRIRIPAPQRIGMIIDTYLDFDNPIKPIIDAIEPIFDNDRFILDFEATLITFVKELFVFIILDSICAMIPITR